MTNFHPDYTPNLTDWVIMRDTYEGERQIKSKTTTYLPATSGQEEDGLTSGQPGSKAYEAYLKRARYHNFVREAVQTAIGMMHSQPPKIQLPKELESISSSLGENIPQLLRRINEEQLITGRLGLLLDTPSGEVSPLPYISLYSAERIINWNSGPLSDSLPQKLGVVVLDETEKVLVGDSLSWVEKKSFRILRILANNYTVAVTPVIEMSGKNALTPEIRGRALTDIPFTVINSVDHTLFVDKPPLLDLANMCLTIYRSEADYRQNLFMQGQDTLCVFGSVQAEGEKAQRVGAGSMLLLPMGGDAKYVGVNSKGLTEQREALQNDIKRAGSMGAQSLDTVSRERESGTSLGIRMAARTCSLTQIAITGASGLEKILKIAAEWIGANPEEVSVSPNLDFGDRSITGQSMVEMQTARNLGYPISAKSLHQYAFDKGLTKLSYEEEIAQADQEKNSVFKRFEKGDRNPDQVN